jgi:hypothetical protein
MTRYVNRWTAQAAWVVLMGIVGLLFIPDGLSGANFAMLAVGGAAVIVAVTVVWGAHQPAVSASQARAAVDAADAAAAAGRRG